MYSFDIATRENLPKIPGAKYVTISGVTNECELFRSLENELNFSDWGRNWDALNDCLLDIEGVKEELVVLYHEDLSMLPDHDMKIYVSILIDSIFSRIYYTSMYCSPVTGLHVVFSPKNKLRVGNALLNYYESMFWFQLSPLDNLSQIDEAKKVIITGIKDKGDLFETLAKSLCVPSCSVCSWETLRKCLLTPECIREEYLILYHNDLSDLPEQDLNVYIDILINAVYSWMYYPSRMRLGPFENKILRVFFSHSNKQRLERALLHFFGV
jgi:hypothetical protein